MKSKKLFFFALLILLMLALIVYAGLTLFSTLTQPADHSGSILSHLVNRYSALEAIKSQRLDSDIRFSVLFSSYNMSMDI